MERKIGEIFEYNGEWYQCIRSSDCSKCDLKIIKDCRLKFPCESLQREDCEEVIFKKLEKVGEPYQYMGGFYQKYRLFSPINETINLKIRQNQEDMEDNKLNLKPFDLEKAKQGKPVCTRDGRKARIICFNAKTLCDYPIIALVENADNSIYEAAYSFSDKGEYLRGNIRNIDLVMPLEEHEG